ncbi:MAG: class I SAM-dependent methyltransferase [Candidatus Binatia bacterium]
MKDSIIPARRSLIPKLHFASLARFARAMVLARLQNLQTGKLVVIDGIEQFVFGLPDSDFPLSVTLSVQDQRFYLDILFGGSVGAGEAYMSGYWSCDNLTTLVRILVRNRAVLEGMETGLACLTAPVRKLIHTLRQNTKSGSRHNIAAHYDLGNEFFSLFLDETMTYSCGIFEKENSSLPEASLAKIDRICRKLQLSPHDHVLEIGTGWGSFALYAAQHYGCRVTTTTISQQQHELAQQRVAAAGLSERITLLLQDYRDLSGQYDKLVSIEMIEAVGHAFYETYFRCCSNLLKPEGMMLLQAILIADQHYEHAKRSVDFIQRYIFPGSCIPSLTAICQAIAKATDMRLSHLEDLTPHYAETLRLWRERFFDNIQQVRALKYPEEFIRMWEFYLCYCEGGFRERVINDVQMLFVKPLNRQTPILPPLPDEVGRR